MAVTPPPHRGAISPWSRRNAAELYVRETIAHDQRLNIFASAWRGDAEEAVVLITARDANAKASARALLGSVAHADWDNGWQELDLGDALIEIHPERRPLS